MTWFKKAAHSITKFGNKANNSIHKFGVKATKAISSGADFLGEKALPAVEKISGGVAKGLTMVEPLVGVIAPEFLPSVEVAKRGASAINMGARAGIAGIAAGRGVVRGAQQIARGDSAGGTANILQSGLAGRTAYQQVKSQGGNAFQAMRDANALT